MVLMGEPLNVKESPMVIQSQKNKWLIYIEVFSPVNISPSSCFLDIWLTQIPFPGHYPFWYFPKIEP